MARCRVFVNPDGSVRVMRPNLKYWDSTECSEEEFCKRICDRDASRDVTLSGLAFYDVDDSTIPTDRSKRHAWRWADNPGVYVDEAVPDRPDPKKEKLDKIELARTLSELKDVLREIVNQV